VNYKQEEEGKWHQILLLPIRKREKKEKRRTKG
jgi:hypothetical protein